MVYSKLQINHVFLLKQFGGLSERKNENERKNIMEKNKNKLITQKILWGGK